MKINISAADAAAIIRHAAINAPLSKQLSDGLLEDLIEITRGTPPQAPPPEDTAAACPGCPGCQEDAPPIKEILQSIFGDKIQIVDLGEHREIPTGSVLKALVGKAMPAFDDPQAATYGARVETVGSRLARALSVMPATAELKDAYQLISEERMEQISKGFDADHDDAHGNGDLAKAALAYLGEYCSRLRRPGISLQPAPCWPFRTSEYKSPQSAQHLLVKVATLAVCELARLVRLGQMETAAAAEVAEEDLAVEKGKEKMVGMMTRGTSPRDLAAAQHLDSVPGVKERHGEVKSASASELSAQAVLRSKRESVDREGDAQQQAPTMIALETALMNLDALMDPVKLHEAARVAYEAHQAVLTGGGRDYIPWEAFSTGRGYIQSYAATRAAAETVVKNFVDMAKLMIKPVDIKG